jgi:hypothetical protein
MAFMHLDSCDHYDSTTSVIKWTDAITVQSGGRTGTNCVRDGTKVFDIKTIITMGVAVKHGYLGDPIVLFTNGATGMAVYIGLLTDSRLYLQFAPRTSVGPATTHYSDMTVCREGWWFYLETQLTHSAVRVGDHSVNTCTYVLRVNEEVVLSGSEVVDLTWPYENPVASGFTQCQFRWSGNYTAYDDIYFTDAEFLGDGNIYVIRPNANGDYSEWDALNGGTQFDEVKDIIPDGDVTYISTEDSGKISMVNLEDLAILGDILGVQFNTIGEKSTSGGAAFKQYNKISGSYVEGDVTIYPSYQNWLDQMCTYRTNPITDENFTLAEINALQIGVKRVI